MSATAAATTSATQGFDTGSLLSAAGSSTGINVQTLVSEFVSADRAPLDAQIASRQADVSSDISSLGVVQGAIGAFQSAVASLGIPGTFSPQLVSSGNQDVVTASANGTAANGTYNIEVDSLAAANQLASKAYVGGGSAVVGTGTLAISSGANGFSITIDSTNNTLTGIQNAINSAPGNTGVQASILNEVDGSHLVLTATQTGAANAITVSETDTGTGLSQLVYSAAGPTKNLTVLQAATDSQIKIGGFTHNSTTNTVSDAIDGLTLNLKAVAVGVPTTVTVANDSAKLTSQVQGFITAYNSMVTTIAPLEAYNATTKVGGALLGDAMVHSIQSSIYDSVNNPVSGLSGNYTSLASVGVTIQPDGTLALDQGKLTVALNAAPSSVNSIFSGSNGLVSRIGAELTTQLSSAAPLNERNQSLQDQQDKITADTASLNARMDVLQTQYSRQFTALNTLLSQLQATSSYLTQALAQLPKPMSTNSGG